ncbi:MAG: SDR family oxidoreductase [Candidatus Pelethousia sp.]|nr:SDR family oxidoreductase [Candidatus Pelethousia sp.]
MDRFLNKVVVVTGAAQGIGETVSLDFYNEGATVCMLDLNLDALEQVAATKQADRSQMCLWKVDISDSEQVNAVFGAIGARFGRIDILVNNAGVIKRCLAEEATDAQIRLMVDVNLLGPMFCTRAAIPHMKNIGANIVNVSSILATFPNTGAGVYGATKAGIMVLTRVWAAELAPYGIRVNCYAPGIVETPMSADVIQTRAESKLAQIALRRFGKTQDIFNLISFYCSDQASYITGQSIGIDGGIWATQTPNAAWRLND